MTHRLAIFLTLLLAHIACTTPPPVTESSPKDSQSTQPQSTPKQEIGPPVLNTVPERLEIIEASLKHHEPHLKRCFHTWFDELDTDQQPSADFFILSYRLYVDHDGQGVRFTRRGELPPHIAELSECIESHLTNAWVRAPEHIASQYIPVLIRYRNILALRGVSNDSLAENSATESPADVPSPPQAEEAPEDQTTQDISERSFCEPANIRDTVEAESLAIRDCYADVLPHNFDSILGEIRVTARFKIGLDGSVFQSLIDMENTDNQEFSQCLTEVIDSLSFDPPDGGICLVTYPFVFSTPQRGVISISVAP